MRSSKKEYLAATLYCLAAAVLFFRGPLLLRRQYHIPYDLHEYHLPLMQLIADSLRSFGQLPWWNPYSYMGEPFFGNVQAAMFYPPVLLTALASAFLWGRVTLWTAEALLVAHVVWAGLGTYVLMKKLGAGRRAALAGATVYSLGAFFASQTQHLGAVSAAAWLPWLLASLRRLEERRDWPSAAFAAITFALMILAGFPAAWLPALFFAPFLYAWWSWQRNPRLQWRAHRRALALLAAALVLALLLSAVSWLPGNQVATRSVASWRPPSQAYNGLQPEALTSLFWPNLFGQLRGDYWHWENPTFLHLYQGIPALLLVFGALAWLAGSATARPFLVACLVSACWLLGTLFPVSHLFYLLYPGWVRRGIYPATVMAYFSLFFAVLAALSLDGWERGARGWLFPRRFCGQAAAIALPVGLVVCLAGIFAPNGSPIVNRGTQAGAALILVAAVLALCAVISGVGASREAVRRPRITIAVCVLILLDLVSAGSHTRLNTYEGEAPSSPEAVEWLRARLGANPIYRIDTTDIGYSWQTNVPGWRLPSANGMDPFLLKDVVFYRQGYSRADDRQFTLLAPTSPLFDLTGVRYIVTSRNELEGSELLHRGEVNIFENRRAFPRYFLVGGAVGARDVSDAADKINKREADPSRVAVVANSDIALLGPLTGPASSEEIGQVRLLAWSPNEFRLKVSAGRPAVLVVTETYWPDWRATVDGQLRPIVRADGLFRAVAIQPGSHEVRMFIVPAQLYLGAALSLAGLVLAGVCLAVRRRARTAPAAPAGQGDA